MWPGKFVTPFPFNKASNVVRGFGNSLKLKNRQSTKINRKKNGGCDGTYDANSPQIHAAAYKTWVMFELEQPEPAIIWAFSRSKLICSTQKPRMALTLRATSIIWSAINGPFWLPSIRVTSTKTLTYLKHKNNHHYYYYIENNVRKWENKNVFATIQNLLCVDNCSESKFVLFSIGADLCKMFLLLYPYEPLIF